MAIAPSLKTDRLILKPVGPWGEFETTLQQIKWLSDPEVVKYSEQRHRTHTLESQRAYHKRINGRLGEYYWEIYSGDSPIGGVTAFIDLNNSIADMGILIGERGAWGIGFGTEAWECAMDWLLWHKVRKVEAGCMAANGGMIKVFQRTGMVFEGARKGHFLLAGDPVDMVFYGKFR